MDLKARVGSLQHPLGLVFVEEAWLRAVLDAPLLLLLIATLASWIPARGASRIDPLGTLRSE